MESTNTWAPSPDYEGYRFKTITKGACTITILRPELGEAEKNKRETHVKNVTERALKNYIFENPRRKSTSN